MKVKVLLISSFVIVTSLSFGIVTDDLATSESAPTNVPSTTYNDFNWDYVYNYKNSSAVAVDSYWILTASHVADDAGTGTLTINSTTYNQQEIVYHDSADLALVRYDNAFPGHYDLYTGTLYTPKHSDTPVSTILVGYGNTGSVSLTSWTDAGSGRATKRWGSQQIDSEKSETYSVGDNVFVSAGFWMNFDSADTIYEAGVGIYDSGGGAFADDNGIWKLAGINTVRGPPDGPPYTSTFSVATQSYDTWIDQTVPEPTMAILVGFAGFISLFIYRFMRNCRQ